MNNKTSLAVADAKGVAGQEELWSYGEPFLTVERVLLRVPRKSGRMVFTDACILESAEGCIVVSSCWIHKPVFAVKEADPVELHCNYYRINPSDLGRMIVATVSVCERKKGPIVELFLDITKTGNVSFSHSKCRLWIKQDSRGTINICLVSRVSCDKIVLVKTAAM